NLHRIYAYFRRFARTLYSLEDLDVFSKVCENFRIYTYFRRGFTQDLHVFSEICENFVLLRVFTRIFGVLRELSSFFNNHVLLFNFTID
ncbi:hypothetical protein L9F63_016907, partial [Diploptera punctata]